MNWRKIFVCNLWVSFIKFKKNKQYLVANDIKVLKSVIFILLYSIKKQEIKQTMLNFYTRRSALLSNARMLFKWSKNIKKNTNNIIMNNNKNAWRRPVYMNRNAIKKKKHVIISIKFEQRFRFINCNS